MPDLIGHPYKPSTQSSTPPHARRLPPNEPAGRPSNPKPRGARPVYRKKRFLIPLGLLLVALGGFAVTTYTVKKVEERRQAIAAERARVAAERERFAAFLDEREARYLQIPLLSDRQRALLRRSRNATHVETAERLGVRSVAERDDVLKRADKAGLVALDPDSPYYRVANLTYSVPYVTPDAAAVLDTIGARFQAKLGAAGLPPYAFHISSVLRTQEDQAALRRVNVNAARGTSSHEFGTTFDLQFRKYHYVGDPAAELWDPGSPVLVKEFAAELAMFYERMEASYRSRFLALLGETLIELENEGVLITVMERRQPVFHTTVARKLTEGAVSP